MIASSGHTMEYVGSGTDYNALPENGGVPVEANQKIELNNGKIWTATTDHNGKFTIGGNQTDDPFFEVDQQLGFVTIPEGSIAFNLLSDLTPQLGGDLDVNGKKIVSVSNGNVEIEPNGTGNIVLDGTVGIGITNPGTHLVVQQNNIHDSNFHADDDAAILVKNSASGSGGKSVIKLDNEAALVYGDGSSNLIFSDLSNERMRIDSSGKVGIGATSPSATLHAKSGTTDVVADFESTDANAWIQIRDNSTTDTAVMVGAVGDDMRLRAGSNERVRIDSSGNVGIGTTSPTQKLDVRGSVYVGTKIGINTTSPGDQLHIHETNSGAANVRFSSADVSNGFFVGFDGQEQAQIWHTADKPIRFATNNTEQMRIDSSGRLLVGTSSSRGGNFNNASGVNAQFQIEGTSFVTAFANIVRNSNDGNPAGFAISKSRGTSAGSNVVVQNNDQIGEFAFQGSDGSKMVAAADIECQIDGTPGSANMPGRLIFSTNGGGTGTTERMRLDSSGRLLVGTSSSSGEPIAAFQGRSNDANDSGIVAITRTGTNPSGSIGELRFATGSDFNKYYGMIICASDGSTSSTSLPGVLRFSTTASGSTSPTERMRLGSDGKLLIGSDTGSVHGDRLLQVGKTDRSQTYVSITSSTSGFGGIVFADTTTNDTGGYRGIVEYQHNNDAMVFSTSADERMRIDSSGNVGIGKSSNLFYRLTFQESAGDAGRIGWVSTSGNRKASIDCGNTAAIVFNTGTGDNERMRIDGNGRVSMAHDGSYYNAGASLSVSASDNDTVQVMRNTNAGLTNSLIFGYVSRTSNSAFQYIKLAANNASDTDFVLRGDGNAYADGSWNGGGADYAEFFEWSDGNAKAEDRRGISVVLDGDKIRQAVAGEEPIGVISGNPSVVGDADIDRWKGKYLRDDYGTYIQEDYEVEDDDGNTVVQQRRKLNPDYNPDTEYVTREDRPEWDTVGLMGKLRIRKGQVIGTRWIKMRDVSDTVEEWLVR